MQSIITYGIMFLLFPVAALAHDFYIADKSGTPFEFAQLGWVWETYHISSMDAVFNFFNDNAPIVWNAFINPLLAQPAFFVAVTPFCIYVTIVIFMMVFGLGTFEGEGLIGS